MKTSSLSISTACLFAAISILHTPNPYAAEAAPATALKVLFLGDNAGHRPADRFKQLQPVLAKNGIDTVYTDSLEDLNPGKLAGFDCLLIYANHTRISPEQEKALLDFVAAGGGFVPVHCASYCFLNSPKYIELVGGQFSTHREALIKEKVLLPDHPALKGLSPIESYDETYVHTKHNTNRIVLAERVENGQSEPYTWVREHGKGRVFYTAWGHEFPNAPANQRTWSNPGFLALIENGIRWASANSPAQAKPSTGLKPFEYMESPDPLPNYTRNAAAWGALSEPIRTMQKPLDPAESMKHWVLLPGFEASLFAAEPDIAKAIWMAWDERGRLWVAETVDYPNNLQPEGQGHDRLKICEDTNGDGRADKFTVFADKLSIPTSFVFAGGGVLIVHSGKIEFFKDTNGDDKADERRTLFTGWGMSDTHATASNFRYGFDNWIWGVDGYSGFRGVVGGKQINFRGQGIYRFRTDGSALEIIRSSNNNTWGLGLSEDNLVFGSTANGNASMYMPIANRYYEAVNGWSSAVLGTIADSQNFYPVTERVRQVDYHGRYTAGAGSAIYTARSFPKEYWNAVQFVSEPTGHLLGKFHLEGRGGDYVAHNGRNFLASDDEWAAPICAEVGPDGALWISDWYNYIIQHNPVPRGFQMGPGNAYETTLRDKTHGRIYRITYRDAKPTPQPPRLDRATPQQLVATLKNENMLWRMHAQRLLVERANQDVVPALCELVLDRSVDEIGQNPAAVHALWTLDGLGALGGANTASAGPTSDALNRGLLHPAASVRRATVMVLPRNESSLKAILAGKLLDDPDAQVRLAALLALSEMPPSEQAGNAIFAMLRDTKNSDDHWIPDAAVAAAARNDATFLKTALSGYKPTATDAAAPANLLPNPSFEDQSNGRPVGWRTTTHSGRGQFTVGEIGHTGNRSAKISSDQGGDISWSATATVTPHTDYRFTGWIKTEKVLKVGQANGAMFNVHELQDPIRGGTKALIGDNDWTQVQLVFNSGDLTQVTMNCLFGGWGRASGTAWFDDVELTPLPGDVSRVVRVVTTHYAQRGPVESIVQTLAALRDASPALAVPVLDGLVSGWPQDRVPTLSGSDKKTLADLMQSLPESVRDRLLALALRWGQADVFGANVAAIIDSLKKQISDAASADDARTSAAKRLMAIDASLPMVEYILKQVSLLTPPQQATGFINTLAESRAVETGQALIGSWPQLTPSVRRTAVATLLRRTDWITTLLDSVEKGTLGRTEVAPDQWTQLKQHSERAISRRATQLSGAGNSVSADREEIVKRLLPLAKEKGDADRGKAVFTTACAVCHVFNGQGGKVGPDLTGVGARERAEILTDILDPNRSVEANYKLWTVTSKNGDTFSGRLENETLTSVEILDTTAQRHVVQRKDLADLRVSQLSIMPVGFESIPADDLKALLEYLTQPHP